MPPHASCQSIKLISIPNSQYVPNPPSTDPPRSALDSQPASASDMMSKRALKEDEATVPKKRSKLTTANNDDDDDDDGEPYINQYAGWTVPTKDYNLPTINTADVTPESFYNDYIKQRRPVVLSGVIPDDLSNIERWKDLNYLEEKVGDHQSIMVEKRSSTNDSFGKGNEIRMSFKKFIRLIKEGDDKHYLTTQDVLANSDGRPDLMSPMMKALHTDFPLRPSLVGNLVPQNINMWMGNSKNGASSGLHHDYHDNLYIVLKGRKKFRLYSPKDTAKLYTRGELLKVHANGRINYVGEETTAYGADLRSDAAALAARQKEEAEKMLEDAERAVEVGKVGAEEQLERAEEELERAMDAVLDVEMGDDDEDDGDGGETSVYEEYGDERRVVDKTVKNPNNFSKVDVNFLEDEEKLKEHYPDVLDANAAFCNVEAGSILYLPASWFHEVTSYGTADGHLALNYWFHPPDGNDSDAPYSTDFWPNDYRDRFDDERE
mmetsp:Transcript_18325/g.38335  ORF Transcript_18325/g.38335 Transcript_18325/m.38335 type:complete len:491 (-) Transcript_18325:10-1482(-)